MGGHGAVSTAADTLNARWRNGGSRPPSHVGAAKPTMLVEARLGHFQRDYEPWLGNDVNARIWGESATRPWQATWTPRSDWIELPNVAEVDIQQDFDSNAVAVATITVENVVMTERTGPLGDIYHLIERGYLSPFRGSPYDLPLAALGPQRPDPGPNAWYGYLTKNAQIRVHQGYGDATVPTFIGIIDDVDLTSSPDTITLTVRDFSKVFDDEHVFGWVKSRQVPEPTIFKSTGKKKGEGVGLTPAASSSRAGYPARFVVDDNGNSRWLSQDHTTPDNTEWVEIRLPRGFYDSFAIHNAYPGMEVYVGVYARSGGLGGRQAQVDGQNVNDGWIFPSEVAGGGDGMVPGTNGGWPYLRRWGAMSDKGNAHQLKHELRLGDDSVLRVGFRNLAETDPGVYRAGVSRLAAIKQPGNVNATRDQKIIEVDDLADMVKVVLRWAGFKEWDVRDTGASIKTSLSFNGSNTLREIIQKAIEYTGFVFYMAPPTDDPDSLGVPTFAPNYAIANQGNPKVIRDTDLLTGIDVKVSDEPLSSIIRVRGKEVKSGGMTLGDDSSKRLMAIYRPPWATNKRLAGLIKHFVAPNEKLLTTQTECMVMAQKIALVEALQAVTAQLEVPGNPTIVLNEKVIVLDTGTGLNTRVHIASRSSTFITGEQASYKTSLGGALIDTTDVQLIIRDLQDTLHAAGRDTAILSVGDTFLVEVD